MKKNYNSYFLLIIFFSLAVLTFFMMKSFLIPFLFALILVHFFNPVYNFFKKRTGRKELSSFLTCLFIALLIIVPTLIILIMTVNEVQTAMTHLSEDRDFFGGLAGFFDKLAAIPFFSVFDFEKIFNQDSILSASKSFSQGFIIILKGAYAGLLRFAFVMFIMFFSLFYMFIDGHRFLDRMIKLIPLQKKYDKVLFQKLNSMIRATIKGTFLIAILQGALGGILFWATGITSPLFFGILIAIASVIPSVGSGLIWLPAGIIMIILGHMTAGLTILAVGFLIISTIDNVLRPKLVGSDTEMHPLLILFSTLGGIAYFGISGFIIGPIIVSLLVSLLDIYLLEIED